MLNHVWYYVFLWKQIRPLWRHYFQNTQGLIFVVDSNDRERVVEARDELHRMLNEVSLIDTYLQFFNSSFEYSWFWLFLMFFFSPKIGDRMSCVMLCYWCLQTSKISQMPWMLLRSLTSLVSIPFASATGTAVCFVIWQEIIACFFHMDEYLTVFWMQYLVQVHPEYLRHIWWGFIWRPWLALQQHC